MKVYVICFVVIAAVTAIGDRDVGDHQKSNQTIGEDNHTGQNSSLGASHKNIGGQGKIQNGSSGGDRSEKHANGTTDNGGGLPKNISAHSGGFKHGFTRNNQRGHHHSVKNFNGTHSHRGIAGRRGTHHGSSRSNHTRIHGSFHRVGHHKNFTGHPRNGHTHHARSNQTSLHRAGKNSHRNGYHRSRFPKTHHRGSGGNSTGNSTHHGRNYHTSFYRSGKNSHRNGSHRSRLPKTHHRGSGGNSTRNSHGGGNISKDSNASVTSNTRRGFHHANDKSSGVGSHKNISGHDSHKNVRGHSATLHGASTPTLHGASTPSSRTTNGERITHPVTDEDVL